MDTPSNSTLPPRDDTPERPPYAPPATIYEADLEIRAGSCPWTSDPLDLFDQPED